MLEVRSEWKAINRCNERINHGNGFIGFKCTVAGRSCGSIAALGGAQGNCKEVDGTGWHLVEPVISGTHIIGFS